MSRDSGSGGRLWRRAGIGIVAALFLWQAMLYIGYVNDDAYITLRYSRFLALGQGPYFNPGERVEGYTNPLLMVLMAVVIRLGGPASAVVAAKSLGVLCGLGCVLLTPRLANSLLSSRGGGPPPIDPVVGGAAAGLVALSPEFALNSTSGLETSLFAFLILSGVVLSLSEWRSGRWRNSGILFSLALLTRPERVVLFGIWWTAQMAVHLVVSRGPVALSPGTPSPARLRDNRVRSQLVNLGIVAGVVAMSVLARRALYEGEWLPNTYYAKIGGFTVDTPVQYILHGLLPPFLGWFGIGLAGAGFLLRPRSLSARWIPVAILGATGVLLPLYMGADWMYGSRLIVPYYPLLAVVLATGWALVSVRLFSRRRAPRIALLAALVFAAGYFQWGLRKELESVIDMRARGYETGHLALANWIRDEVGRPGDSIALMDIGIVGFTCIDQTIIDITGLTDRFIAKSPGVFMAKNYDPSYVLDRKPTFVVLVLTDEGSSFEPVPPDATLDLWSDMERRLHAAPEFQENYVRRRDPPPEDPTGLAGLAARVGAERIFPHDHPGRRYLLAVFRRG